jgi:hypothetical protein
LHLAVVLPIKLLPIDLEGRRFRFHAARHSAFVPVKERMNILLVRVLARMSLSLRPAKNSSMPFEMSNVNPVRKVG